MSAYETTNNTKEPRRLFIHSSTQIDIIVAIAGIEHSPQPEKTAWRELYGPIQTSEEAHRELLIHWDHNYVTEAGQTTASCRWYSRF